MRTRIIRLFIACTAIVLTLVSAWASDDAVLVNAEQQLRAVRSDLERIQGVIGESTVTDEQLAEQRKLLERLREEIATNATKLQPPLQEIEQRLLRLGPRPQDNTLEAQAIVDERNQLADQSAKLTATSKQFEVTQVAADQVLTRLLALQRELFLERIFKADRSVLNPRLWVESAGGFSLLVARISSQVKAWWGDAPTRINLAGFLIIPVGLAILLAIRSYVLPWLGAAFGASRQLPVPDGMEPPLLRLWRAVWGLIKFALLTPFLVVLLLVAMSTAEILTPQFERLVSGFLAFIISAAFYSWIAYLVAAPSRPERRLIAVDNTAARTLVVTVALAATISSLGNQLASLADDLYVPVTFTIGQSAFSALIIIVLVMLALLILRRQAAADLGGQGTPYFLAWFLRLTPLLWLLLAVALGALFLGYIALSYFIIGNLLDTAMLVVVLGVVHAFVHAFGTAVGDASSTPGQYVRRVTGWGDAAVAKLVLIFRTLTDIILVFIAIPSLVAMWTVTLVDFTTVLSRVASGIHIGNIVISPSALAIAFAVLALGIVVTRLLTSWLQQRVLSETRLDKGAQDSLRTGASYAGYTLAAALALSAAGLDFSTLAIIAGALGVGIGFGLQSIVNNFVSGLILLAERPIRVGDWIVTASGEGIVKRINVRATELETFDNCSVIVPNSNLITGPVRNWTLRDSIGRFNVAVGVVYGSNADEVVKALVDLAVDHPKVLRHPPPTAQLVRLAPYAMEFELVGLVKDVMDAAHVASDLRLAIVRTFPKKKLAVLPNLDVVRPK